VTREEWRAYYEYHQGRTLHVGIQGISFLKVVAPAELARHVESIRAEGFPEYSVWPGGDRALYTPVVLIEPSARNLQALGYDAFSEPVRRAAMEWARDAATVAMSGRVRLVHETDEDLQAGFVIFAPVYARGMPQTNVEARRAALTGYVGAVLRVKDFMRSIFAEAPQKVAFELYDGATVSPESLLFASREPSGGSANGHRSRFSGHTHLELYGHTWNLAFRSTPQFEAEEAPYLPWIILAAGLVVSILIFILMRSQQSIVAKAAALAAKLTVDLRRSEERFEQSTRHGRTFVWETDAAGLYTYASAAVEDLLGYRPEELVGKKTICDLHPVEGREAFRTAAAEIIANKRSFSNLENRVETKSGEVIWVSSNGIPLLDAGGNLIAHRGSDTDITERKQAEDALHQRIAYEQLVHEVSTMALVADDLSAFLDRCLALFGERLGVDRAYCFRHDEASDTMDNTHEWCAEGIEPQQDKLQRVPGSAFSWWIQTMRRNEVICYSNIEEIPDEAAQQILRDQDIKSILVVPLFINGQYYGFLGFDDCSRRRDWQQENIDNLLSLSMILSMVTERKQAEDAVRQAKEDWEKTFDAVPDGIIILDLEYRVKQINRAYAAMLGLQQADCLGRTCYELLHGTMEPPSYCPHARLLEDGQPHTAETREEHLGKDLALGAFPLCNSEGRLTGSVHIIRDITERKQAESDRIARQSAEQANRAKSVFLANMSHEIRTPLNAVLGFAQILERDASLSPRQTGMLQTIARSGRHLLDLINDILDMSKIEAGRLELSPADFCLHDLLDDLELMFRSRAQARQLQLLMERDDSVPRYVTADEGKLRQVMINLMGNAIKFTKTGGGFVRVRAEAATGNAGGETNAVRLVVEVEDSGPGIAEDELGRIFEPFRQSAAGREAGGTGLGLVVSRRLVELMGGRLTVKSQVGKGSCFRFDALVKLAEEAAQEEERETRQVVGLEPGTGPFRILVADDQKDNRDLLAALLEPLGFEVREAVNGQEALEVFEAWSPHAVLMDMRMPALDGYEATRRIKATERGRATPVIAVTASAFDHAEKEVRATGVDGYVRKPFRAEEIFAVLEKCLGLRYVYAEGCGQALEQAGIHPLTREELAALPEALRQAMRQAVDEGDMARLHALIAQIEEKDAAAARKLRNLADQYDYETLTHVLTEQGEGGTDE
jgi:PAS domain S-box-containing protein